jgi:hypothetical protein
VDAARIAAVCKVVMPGAFSTSRRSIGVALVVAAALLTVTASPAGAKPPRLTTAAASGGLVSATWSLPAGVGAEFFEIAESPDVNAYGYFRCNPAVCAPGEGASIRFGVLGSTQTSLTPTDPRPPLPAGTYYLHIAGHDRIHDGCPLIEFSDIMEIQIDGSGDAAATSQPAAPGTGDCTLIRRPGGVVEGGGGGGGAFPGDKTAPAARLRFARKQDIDKFAVRASMSEPGTLTVGALVRIGRLPGRTYVFRTASRKVNGGVLAKLRLKPTKKDRRALKRALRNRKRLRARITLTATDRAGNSRTVHGTVALKQ